MVNNMSSEQGRIPKPPTGPIHLSEAQVIQRIFESHIIAPQDRVPSSRVDRFMQEASELEDLRRDKDPTVFDAQCESDPRFRKAVASEAIDTVIIAIGIIDSLGMDAHTLFMEKMNINFAKYNIGRMEALVAGGMSHEEAQQVLKREWGQRFPKNGHGDHEYEYQDT